MPGMVNGCEKDKRILEGRKAWSVAVTGTTLLPEKRILEGTVMVCVVADCGDGKRILEGRRLRQWQ